MARWDRVACVAVASALLLVASTAALGGGAPPAPAPTLTGPTRGGLNIVLPYYPATPRAAAMGNATVALAGVDSHNPAALAFATKIDIEFDYGRMNFNHGPDLDMYHGHIVVPTPGIGGFTKILGMGISTRNDDVSRMGAKTHVWGRQFGICTGVPIPLPDAVPGKLGFGFAGFPSDPSELRLSSGGTTLATGRAQSQIGSIRLGFLYIPLEQVSIGAEFTHIKDWLRQRALVPQFGYITTDAHYYVNLWTFGAAFHPDDKTTIVVQHLTGRAQGPGVRAQYDAFSVGLERTVPISEEISFALRAGIHDSNPTFGLGVGLPRGFRVDYALLSNYGEQLDRAFGHGTLHIIGVGKSF